MAITDSYYEDYLSSQDLIHHINSDYMTWDDAGHSEIDAQDPQDSDIDYLQNTFEFTTDNMFKPDPYSRSKQDYTEFYDEVYKISSRRVKTALFRKGDWVSIRTNELRHPFSLSSPMQRAGVVYDSMGNGWYMVKTLKGDFVPLYEGDSDMDRELELIDIDMLYQKSMANKQASHDQQNRIKRLLMVMRMYGENIHDLTDTAIDENKQTYLEQSYDYP